MNARLTRPRTTAAAMGGISVTIGRRIEGDPRPPSAGKEARQYRTRINPLEGLGTKSSFRCSQRPLACAR